MNHGLKKRLFISIIPVLIGAGIYYLFCPDVIFVKLIDNSFGINSHIEMADHQELIRILRFYLLDFLWAFSLMAMVLSVMGMDSYIFWIIGIIFFEVVIEFSQMSNIVPGTFDPIDLVVELFADFLACIILRRTYKNEKVKENS